MKAFILERVPISMKKIFGTTKSSKMKEVTSKWPYFGYNI